MRAQHPGPKSPPNWATHLHVHFFKYKPNYCGQCCWTKFSTVALVISHLAQEHCLPHCQDCSGTFATEAELRSHRILKSCLL